MKIDYILIFAIFYIWIYSEVSSYTARSVVTDFAAVANIGKRSAKHVLLAYSAIVCELPNTSEGMRPGTISDETKNMTESEADIPNGVEEDIMNMKVQVGNVWVFTISASMKNSSRYFTDYNVVSGNG